VTRALQLLLVEDSEADAELLLIELRRCGFNPSHTRVDTEAALRTALRARPWDFVLCDHGLPAFSSAEALEVVRESGLEVPFLILSGTIGEEAAVDAMRAGARDVVLKTNLARLGPVVERELREAEGRRRQERLERERLELDMRLVNLNEELRASELRYRLLFDNNPQPMLVYDRETLEIVTANDALVTDYGYSRDDLAALRIVDLVPAEDVGSLHSWVGSDPRGQRARFAGEPDYPHLCRRKDGTTVDIEVTSDNLVLDGRDCRIVLFHDVTARNKAVAELAIARDEAVEASNMKSAFLANMSHEIRTPMNGVIGMNELLLDMGLTEEQREVAAQVARSGEQMLAIINDILDISRIETGHVELDIADFDLHQTITDTCSAVAVQATAKGLRLDVHIDDEVPAGVRGDERRLQQILLNVLSNAVKFTSTGAVTVHVSATTCDEDDPRIRLEVTDTGIGIDPASLQRMFEPFTQADVSTTRLYGGTGLGLAIARELTELMHGTIGAESQPGRGSTFHIELPLAAPRAAHRSDDPGTGVATADPWPRAPLILVVEDSQINQIVAVRTLERCGCRADVVSDGRAALEALRGRHYDAVLMDCQMPDMDGYRATSDLRRSERDTQRHTPVIAMTAHAMAGDRERCLNAGMDDYITKPLRHAELDRTLRRWIKTRTA
jgi:two-component system, sensor histidine kinase